MTRTLKDFKGMLAISSSMRVEQNTSRKYVHSTLKTWTIRDAGEARLTSADLSDLTEIVMGQFGGRPRILYSPSGPRS